jgi:hypothetical protein
MVTISEKMLTMRNWTVKFATISSFTGGKGPASERERDQQLFNQTTVMFMRNSAFRAIASSAIRVPQHHMEMGIFPIFFNHHHITTSTCTNKPFLPQKNGGFVSNTTNNISIDDALASFYSMVRMNPRLLLWNFANS